MLMHRFSNIVGMLGLLGSLANPAFSQQAPAPANTGSKAQALLEASAEAGKFTFIVFYKEDSAATRDMARVVQESVATQQQAASIAFAQSTQPIEQQLVERFGIGRAPMPLTVAVAPNGAITGVFSKTVKADDLEQAIVPPVMMACMKQLQEKKLVFVCLNAGGETTIPAGVRTLQADPMFKERIVLVPMDIRDPQESRFLSQMQVKPAEFKGELAVLIAPPGVLIGKFDSRTPAPQIAAALHKAGQCCDDANCKHNHGAAPQATQPGTGGRN